jgi:hypothetical protein
MLHRVQEMTTTSQTRTMYMRAKVVPKPVDDPDGAEPYTKPYTLRSTNEETVDMNRMPRPQEKHMMDIKYKETRLGMDPRPRISSLR